ncbi:MAG: hypothetical protein KDE55_14080 [Novosphingobium sp.]|nr:hypothetical protein [Novosphingobium sp.]
MSYIEPSGDRARAYRDAMDKSLWESVASLLGDDIAQPATRKAGPRDYGAYFDLASDHPADGPVPEVIRKEATIWLQTRMSSGTGADTSDGERSPAIRTLTEEDLGAAGVARLIRWWDVDPGNPMMLTAATPEENADARDNLAKAFAHLSQCDPELHDEIVTVVDEVILSSCADRSCGGTFAGASSFALWGAIAVNAGSLDSWPRYFQALVHEAGHNLLFAMARDEPLVTNDPCEKRSSPLRDDLRPLDGIFHAAFVSARESLAFDRLLAWGERTGGLSDDEAAAVEKLLDTSVVVFAQCVETLRGNGRFTPLGDAILSDCERFMAETFAIVAH